MPIGDRYHSPIVPRLRIGGKTERSCSLFASRFGDRMSQPVEDPGQIGFRKLDRHIDHAIAALHEPGTAIGARLARNSPADCFPTIDDWDKPLMDNV